MRKFVVLIALLVVVLAGCRVESNVILEINEDGSALVGAEVGFDEEFQALMEDGGANPSDLFGDLPTVGDDIVTIERTDGDMTYVGVASNVDDLSSISDASEALESFTSFSYQFDEESATLDAVVSTVDAGIGGGELEELGFDPSQLTDDFFSANVVVTMPGEVTEHNADIVRSDGTLVWKIPLTGEKEIMATSTFGSASSSLLLLALAALVVIAIAVAVIYAITNRRKSEKSVAEAEAAHVATETDATLEMTDGVPEPDTTSDGAEGDTDEDQAETT